MYLLAGKIQTNQCIKPKHYFSSSDYKLENRLHKRFTYTQWLDIDKHKHSTQSNGRQTSLLSHSVGIHHTHIS